MYTHRYKPRSRIRLHAGTYRENCHELKGKLKEANGHEREQHQNRDKSRRLFLRHGLKNPVEHGYATRRHDMANRREGKNEEMSPNCHE